MALATATSNVTTLKPLEGFILHLYLLHTKSPWICDGLRLIFNFPDQQHESQLKNGHRTQNTGRKDNSCLACSGRTIIYQ